MTTPAATRRLDRADPVRRFDVGGELLKPVRRKSDGAMLYECIVVREGVLEYRLDDGSIRRELVTRQAVEDTARTLARGSVTLDHPSLDDGGFVTPDNADRLSVGDIDGQTFVEEDELGGFAKVRIAVRTKPAQDAIDAGKRETSPGYDVGLDETPGEHPVYGAYDARQISRDGNHLAIVDKGRGDRPIIRTDSSDAVQVGRVEPTPKPAARRTDTREALMNPLLTRLLTILGVARLDDEDAALKAAATRVVELKAEATQRADADQAAAAEVQAGHAALDAALSQASEILQHMDAEEEGDKPAEGADLKAKVDKLAADMASMKKEFDGMKKAKEDMEEEEQKKADAAELTRLQGVADQLRVDHAGLALPKLREAIVLTRLDAKAIEGKPPEFLAATLAVIEADLARGDTTRDDRWDWSRRGDSDANDPPPNRWRDRDKPFTSRYLDHADKARDLASGGAK